MRKDMKKVLTERPRHGHARSYHEIRSREKRVDFDQMPACQGIRYPYGYDHKDFTDLLGPLIRFLWSCRGRRWDDVWSEICGQLSNNTTGAHLKDHVRMEVDMHVFEKDGKLFGLHKYTGMSEVRGLYVDPRTGILCGDHDRRNLWKKRKLIDVIYVDGISYQKGEDDVLRPIKVRHLRGVTPNVAAYSRKLIGFEKEAVYVDGYWYWVMFDTVPPPSLRNEPGLPPQIVHHVCTDFVTGKSVREGRYRASKRQMSAVDMKRHGLVNHDSANRACENAEMSDAA